jgi:limonene-1,2-epoxide hydrolase
MRIEQLRRTPVAPSPHEQLVREFFAAMGPTLEDFKTNFRQRLAEDVVWESVGLPAHHGRQACIDYLDILNTTTGMQYCKIDILHIATAGDVVLSERVDTMLRADGTEIRTFRLMGAVEVREGHIVRYTDYFDTAPIRLAEPPATTTT